MTAGDLADLFFQWSQQVDSYRDQNFQSLTPDEQTRLKDLSHQLDDISAHFTLSDIANTLGSIECDLEQIKTVTTEAKEELKKAQTALTVIKIASAAAALGLAIASGNPGTIGGAISDLANLMLVGPQGAGRGKPIGASAPAAGAEAASAAVAETGEKSSYRSASS